MMKAANRILIAKMQTAKLLQQEGRSVQEAIGRMAEAEIAEAVAAAEGIVVVALVVAVVRAAGAIAVLVAAEEIAETAK